MVERSPTKFGKCVVTGKLGEGATAVVFLAKHEGLGMPVAVKVLRKQLSKSRPEYAQRFLREARVAARLEHPNIVRVIDCGVENGYHYMVMDYVDGQDCMELLRSHPDGLPWRQATQIVRQAAIGLFYAAEHSIIHRDVKPSNLMIDKNGRVRVTDLGLAKLTVKGVAALTQELHTIGTPNYMSPEQIRSPKDLDLRADIYSLGATYYHMVTGGPPFVGDSLMGIVSKHLTEPLVPPYKRKRDLPAAVSMVICKMMAKVPGHRYASYEELCRDLDSLLEGKKIQAGEFEERYVATEEDEKLMRIFERLSAGGAVEIEGEEDADLAGPAPAAEPGDATTGASSLAPFDGSDLGVYNSAGEGGDSTLFLHSRGRDRLKWLIAGLVIVGVLTVLAIALAGVFLGD